MVDPTVSRLRELPSAQDFASSIEARNIPLVLDGFVKTWPAYSKWRPQDGGLEYLKSVASAATVQAMVSTSGSNFYGDIRSHERVSVSFGSFLDVATSCVKSSRPSDSVPHGRIEEDSSERKGDRDGSFGNDPRSHLPAGSQLYLAQVPVYNKEQQELCSLGALMQDISVPGFLDVNAVTNINLWMSGSESKSSTHYDPFHNILCVVAGCKHVTLWPPTATPFLSPLPIYGEASNHSAVDFVKPDLQMHPLFEHASKCCQVVVLHPGDALFIPEGWYHQVNSDSLTIAVNMWWPSTISLALNSHMDGYYLRRIVASLVDREKDRMVEMVTSCKMDKEEEKGIGASKLANPSLKEESFQWKRSPNGFTSCKLDKEVEKGIGVSKQANLLLKDESFQCTQSTNDFTAEKSEQITDLARLDNPGEMVLQLNKGELQRQFAVEQLTSLQRQCLESLVLFNPDDGVNSKKDRQLARKGRSGSMNGDPANGVSVEVRAEHFNSCQHQGLVRQGIKSMDYVQGRDLVANVFCTLEPVAFQQLLIVMANHFPRTLEALIMYRLSPLAAELLTRKFDEIDKVNSESQQAEFYKIFYSVFDNPQKAMAALLDGKEAFSALALDTVMEGYLGLHFSPLSSTT